MTTSILKSFREAAARPVPASTVGRLTALPYPANLEESLEWSDRQVLLRPIRPEDEAQHLRFLEQLDLEDIRMRVHSSRRQIAPAELARLARIDYDREMAFIATAHAEGSPSETLGVVRAVIDADSLQAEFGIIVRSDLKGHGLGRLLLEKMIRYLRGRGIRIIVGDVLRENSEMRDLAEQLGFEIVASKYDEPLRIRLAL